MDILRVIVGTTMGIFLMIFLFILNTGAYVTALTLSLKDKFRSLFIKTN